jgi:hypothetical protein
LVPPEAANPKGATPGELELMLTNVNNVDVRRREQANALVEPD